MQTIHNNLDLSRFEIYDDGRLAGCVFYRMNGQEIWFLNTQMLQHDNPKLTTLLIRSTVEEASRRRLAVLPFCLAIRAFMRTDPRYLALIPAQQQARLQLTDLGDPLQRTTGERTVSAENKRPFSVPAETIRHCHLTT
ncbi:hypothetical protein IV500_13835 [Paeniglutamicibacter antarcticus]|uniref:N-acetyltransferase domain-containing protein n=1 Tax=Arthrobacter terrae TaxID=2935737 RepID=A0A931CP57_9MICC|nr:hypothetical protein [Arthrobacter terrae]MBG0740462.1 hypothetical protein [Arthrobacter terrae]